MNSDAQGSSSSGSGTFTASIVYKEEWRKIPVKFYEGYYEISSFGNVRRIRSARGASKNKDIRQITMGGYYNVHLSKWNIVRCFHIHSLVALAFLGPQPQGTVVNHKDGKKKNNHFQNLEYISPKKNSDHYWNRVHKALVQVRVPVDFRESINEEVGA
jgi:HNH endonuclease/NUMOD4 motif